MCLLSIYIGKWYYYTLIFEILQYGNVVMRRDDSKKLRGVMEMNIEGKRGRRKGG